MSLVAVNHESSLSRHQSYKLISGNLNDAGELYERSDNQAVQVCMQPVTGKSEVLETSRAQHHLWLTEFRLASAPRIPTLNANGETTHG